MPKQKLELTWIGKENRPRILLEDAAKSYHASHRVSKNDLFDNRLIFGDNLLALKALEQEFTGKIKFIYIDPPYNTGSAFAHYDDGVEHSLWLGMMRDRIELLRRLLAVSGSLWITLDDNGHAYRRVLCDEIFGRTNFVGSLAWHKRVSPANDGKYFSADHDHIFVFAKDIESWRSNRLPKREEQLDYYKNPDHDPRGPWNSGAYTCAKTPTSVQTSIMPSQIQTPTKKYGPIELVCGHTTNSAIWKMKKRGSSTGVWTERQRCEG
jgi:adenine-specific DNA-methyltransferase